MPIKVAVFHGCKNIHMIWLVPVAIIYKDYYSQSDRLSCWYDLLYFGRNQQIMSYWKLSLHFCSFLDLFLHATLPRAFGSKICSFHFVQLLQRHLNFSGTEWLVEMDWKNLENDRNFLVVLVNVTGCNNFSKFSPYVKKTINPLRQVMQAYSKICVVIVYI